MAQRGRPRKNPPKPVISLNDPQEVLAARIAECEQVLNHWSSCAALSVITADLERGKQAVDEHWHEISDPVKLQEWRVQKFAYQYLLTLKQQYEDDLKTAKIELEKIQNPKREINKDYDNE